MKNPGCWICKHYCQESQLITTSQRNVSDGLVQYRRRNKNRCNLKQEDRYPNQCDFEMNTKLRKELEERYPDLATASRRIENGTRKVAEIKRKINETVNRRRSKKAS